MSYSSWSNREVEVAQITSQQRAQRIQELHAEVNGYPPERHETLLVHLSGGERLCDVIQMKADEVLLNHRSHRIRSQLEGDPEWEIAKSDPTSESAQRIVSYHVRHARKEDEFEDLKASLRQEGQNVPGVMTYDGVLVNANTRAVAMRELEDPESRIIRVAVLPKTTQQDEIGLLELRLQMQKELKVDYTLTNGLLFIEELSNDRGMSDAAIAAELRDFPKEPKKGAAEVAMRLKFLDLLRTMQRIPKEPLKLHQFDSLKLQHLRDVFANYQRLLEQDHDRARIYLENFLLSVLVGVTSVHQIRVIDPEFIRTYMLPSLEEDELIGQFAVQLASAPDESKVTPQGASALIGKGSSVDEEGASVISLINAVAGRHHTVKVPGSNITLEQKDVADAIREALVTGIKDKRREERQTDRIEAPIEAVKSATREVGKASEALRTALTDSEFGVSHRKTLEASFKKLQRSLRSLEAALSKAGITGS
jgi:hypothetical protein